jgi:hypothetical protein
MFEKADGTLQPREAGVAVFSIPVGQFAAFCGWRPARPFDLGIVLAAGRGGRRDPPGRAGGQKRAFEDSVSGSVLRALLLSASEA